LFDFDGTLTTTESFPAFLRRVVPKSRLRWGGVLVLPLVLAYRLRLLSGNVVRAAILRIATAAIRWSWSAAPSTPACAVGAKPKAWPCWPRRWSSTVDG
jgi:hypothetical protein